MEEYLREFIYNKEGKPHPVFIFGNKTTTINLGWFNKDLSLTNKGIEQMKVIEQNINK